MPARYVAFVIALSTIATLSACSGNTNRAQSINADNSPPEPVVEPVHDKVPEPIVKPEAAPAPTARESAQSETPRDASPQDTAETEQPSSTMRPSERRRRAEQAERSDPPPLRYRVIGTPRSLHYADVRRFDVRIRVQRGHSRKRLSQLLESAARQQAHELNADAVDISAFAVGDEATGIATAGRAILAPNGNWEDAAKDDPIAVRVVFLAEGYFRDPSDSGRWAEGSRVRLSSSNGRPIGVSRSRTSWYPEDLRARVPGGTRATILERHSSANFDGSEFVRYRVRVAHRGRIIEGWVFQRAVEGDPVR